MSVTSSTQASISPEFAVSQSRVIHSEWTKFRSLRSTVITLAVAVFLTVAISLVFALVSGANYHSMSPIDRLTFNAASTSVNGALFAQLAFAVLGVLLMSGEYSTGMIQSSLTVVPRRLPVLWGKIVIFTAGAGVVALATSFIAFFVGQAIMSSHHIQVNLSSPGALRIVVGSALYVTLVGVMGIALGALLRSTAAGISALVGLLFVIPPILELLPQSWTNDFGKYLPGDAGQALWLFHPGPAVPRLSPWTGFVVMCVWVVVLIALSAYRLARRDA
jgi:ABC-2 type transport system permease protein